MSTGGNFTPRTHREHASRYELLLKIASGGMGTVYVARATDLDRLVAVKRAHAHLLEDPSTRMDLLREAQLASRIRHANVASVHDVEETSEGLLLVMEYVEGASLSGLLDLAWGRHGTFPPSVAVRIVLDVAQGLAAVHELVGDDGQPLCMVHRDVSPQNVLVGLDGTSRVADFGLAKLASARDASRSLGTIQGKLAYLSPELLDGVRCNPRSELFSLAILLWETLASRRLFRGASDAETLRRVARAEAPPISSAAPHLGHFLDDVLGRALARDPAARQASVRAFANELERAARSANLIATTSEVSATVEALAGAGLAERREQLGLALAAHREGRETSDALGRVVEARQAAAPSARDDLPTIPESPDESTRFKVTFTPAPSASSEASLSAFEPSPRRGLGGVLAVATAISLFALGGALAVVWPRGQRAHGGPPTDEAPSRRPPELPATPRGNDAPSPPTAAAPAAIKASAGRAPATGVEGARATPLPRVGQGAAPNAGPLPSPPQPPANPYKRR